MRMGMTTMAMNSGGGVGYPYSAEALAYFARVETDNGTITDKSKADADITLLKTSGISDAIIAAGQGFCWTASAGSKIDATAGITSLSRIYNMIPITGTPANYDYAQSTKGAQPLWADGKMVLTDNAHQILAEVAARDIANGIINLTAFSVIQSVSVPAGTGYVFAAINAPNTISRLGFGRSTTKHMAVYSNNDEAATSSASTGDMITATGIVQTVKMVFANGTGTANIRENGTEVLALATLTNVIPNTSPAMVKIGNLILPSFPRSPKVTLSAIIVLPFAVSNAVRNAIEAHLLSVYGG